MKKILLSLTALAMVFSLAKGQEILVNDFTGTLDPEKIYGDNNADGNNYATVTFENNMLRSDYEWTNPSWYPRAVWYKFDDYLDMSSNSVLIVKFMVDDANDDTPLPVRLDLYGDEVAGGQDRTQMETNGNPWTMDAEDGEWYTVSSDFEADNRWYCTYWQGPVDATRVDSSKIMGFEAFVSYAGYAANKPGTLWIDFIKISDQLTGVEKVVFGHESAFGIAVYAENSNLRVKSENVMASVRVIDMTGKTVLNRTDLYANEADLSLENFANGMYIAAVTDVNGKVVTKKFMNR